MEEFREDWSVVGDESEIDENEILFLLVDCSEESDIENEEVSEEEKMYANKMNRNKFVQYDTSDSEYS